MPKENEQKENMVSFYDPIADAFRDIPVSQARKLIKSAKEVEAKIGKE